MAPALGGAGRAHRFAQKLLPLARGQFRVIRARVLRRVRRAFERADILARYIHRGKDFFESILRMHRCQHIPAFVIQRRINARQNNRAARRANHGLEQCEGRGIGIRKADRNHRIARRRHLPVRGLNLYQRAAVFFRVDLPHFLQFFRPDVGNNTQEFRCRRPLLFEGIGDKAVNIAQLDIVGLQFIQKIPQLPAQLHRFLQRGGHAGDFHDFGGEHQLTLQPCHRRRNVHQRL